MTRILFIILLLFTQLAHADNLKSIETEWAQVHYSYPIDQKEQAFADLLIRLDKISAPEGEWLRVRAVIMLTQAGVSGVIDSYEAIFEAKDLLTRSLSIKETSSALVTLGVLYYRVPSWPIAFGDDDKAAELLLAALTMEPHGMDTNYFYGQFLLDQGNDQGVHFIKTATETQPHDFASTQLKEQAEAVLDESLTSEE